MMDKKLVDFQNVIFKIPIFVGLDRDEVNKIVVPILALKEFKKGEVIFNEGDVGHNIYLLLEGDVDLCKKSPAGDLKKMFTMHAPNMFGEMALIDTMISKIGVRSAAAIASSDCSTYSLKKMDFDRLIKTHHDMAMNIIKRLARIIGLRGKKMSAEYEEFMRKLEHS